MQTSSSFSRLLHQCPPFHNVIRRPLSTCQTGRKSMDASARAVHTAPAPPQTRHLEV